MNDKLFPGFPYLFGALEPQTDLEVLPPVGVDLDFLAERVEVLQSPWAFSESDGST